MADQKKDEPVQGDKKDEAKPPVRVIVPGDKKTFKSRGVEKRG
jgi:hypothetical protein